MVEIDELNKIAMNKEKKHYTYKSIDFLTDVKTCKNLVVLFHGIGNSSIYPIFRGYNYNFENSMVMSISDPLIKYYNEVNIGWYLDTEKYPNTTNTINEILNYLKKLCQIKNIIFVSNCSGALISLKLACIMNEYCLIANPHTILKSNDTFVHGHWNDDSLKNGFRMPLKSEDNYKKVKILHQILIENNDKICSFEMLDSRTFFELYGLPKKLVCFTHKKDYTVDWLLKLKEYFKKNDKKKIYIELNDEPCKSPHHSPFKTGKNLKYSINSILRTI